MVTCVLYSINSEGTLRLGEEQTENVPFHQMVSCVFTLMTYMDYFCSAFMVHFSPFWILTAPALIKKSLFKCAFYILF